MRPSRFNTSEIALSPRLDIPTASEGGIDLSDGTIHLAVLPVRTEAQRLGFEHIGFAVEDEQEACRRLEAAGAREFGRTVDPYQIKFEGPEGIEVEIGDWPGTEPIRKDEASGA